MGHAGYVAPEVIENHPHTPAMDMYACGVILFMLLTGVVLPVSPTARIAPPLVGLLSHGMPVGCRDTKSIVLYLHLLLTLVQRGGGTLMRGCDGL